MVASPNQAPERLNSGTEGVTSTLLERMMAGFERPTHIANNNVALLSDRLEVVNEVTSERTWLQRNIVDRFTSQTETGSELFSHRTEVRRDLTAVQGDVTDLAAVWQDDRRLGRRLDEYERYNSRYGNQARQVIESQIEGGNDDSETVIGVIDENSTPEEIAAIEAQQEENRLRQAALERWNQFAFQQEAGGRWRVRRLTESALSMENIKNAWQNRTSFFSFFRTLGADYAQWRAVKSAVPAVNVVSFGVREGRRTLEPYREIGETVAQGAQLVVDARGTQREVRREGAEAVVLTSAAARSEYTQTLIGRLMRGEISREQALTSARAAFTRFQRQDPAAFAQMIRGYGLTARSLNTRAGFYELFKNAALWYTPWGDRGDRSFWEANETAVPIWGTYAAWRDINVDNGLPLWSRIGFASAGTALDIGTVLSFGTLTPALVAGKVALAKGSQALARRLAQQGVTRAAVEAGAQTGGRTLAQVLGSLPRAARNAVANTGVRGVAIGAAGYTALSAGVDYLFSLEERAVDLAFIAAETALGQEFSPQQRRLLRIVGQEVEPVVREAYADYRREEETEEIVPEEEVPQTETVAETETDRAAA